jgi:RimJ/RimL family protein N-acetyltransferase
VTRHDETVLTLRPVRPDDWSAVHTWASRPEFCRYQPWGPNTPDASRRFVDNAAAAWTQSPQARFPYVAVLDGQPVGTGELWIRNRDHRQGEITYGLHPDLWGRGLGTLIGHELLAIGFARLDLHRVYATCDPRNVGSSRVLRKLGMTHEGTLRQTMLIRDGWRDSDVFSILTQEWTGRWPQVSTLDESEK